MGKWGKFLLNIGKSVVIGIIFGIIFGIIHFVTGYEATLPIVIFIVVIFVLFEFFLDFYIPIYIMFRGRYDEAIIKMKRLIERKKYNERSRDSAIFNLANCYHRKGDFDESINYLNKINQDTLDKNLKHVYYSLYAENLLMLERNIDLAEKYLNRASDSPKHYKELLAPYIFLNLLKGDIEKSNEYVQVMQNNRNRKSFIITRTIILLVDRKFKKIQDCYALGLHYYRMMSYDLAKKYLIESSNCSYSNCYSERAKLLLEKINN
jgi:tetratricopeptide (TPR) repeat protein